LKNSRVNSPFNTPSKEVLDAFAIALDQIKADTVASLGEKDRKYIYRLMAIQRLTELAGRGLLMAGWIPPLWLAGTALLSFSKILDNMEIGHNVMHGQYDFMNDKLIHSSNYEWDMACAGSSWKRTHNYHHHAYTNILGKDRDYGYSVMRLDDSQPWTFEDLFNLPKMFALSAVFQWGVAFFEMDSDKILSGEIKWREKKQFIKEFLKKGFRQVFKEYMFLPLLGLITGAAIPVLIGNLVSNVIRNLWASSVIFCGHFPDGVHTFSEEECENESKGHWYYRQILGSCNFKGRSWLHLMSGHLSFQVEHHLFPDIPAHRYREMAPKVKAVCDQYGIAYNTDSFVKQYATVVRKVFKFSFPWAKTQRPSFA
jgi:fatty acid desaturase